MTVRANVITYLLILSAESNPSFIIMMHPTIDARAMMGLLKPVVPATMAIRKTKLTMRTIQLGSLYLDVKTNIAMNANMMMPTMVAVTAGGSVLAPKNATSSAPVANPAPKIALMSIKTSDIICHPK